MLPLLQPTELLQEIETLRPSLSLLFSSFEKKEITAAEAASLYVLTFMHHRFGNLCWSGRQAVERWDLCPKSGGNKNVEIQLPEKMARKLLPKWDLTQKLHYLFSHYRLRHLSFRINQSCIHFLEGNWNFELLTYVPSALEVLRFQAQGKRPVSMITDFEKLGNYVEGKKDGVNFLLHDLAHGERFFHHPEQFKAQVGMYRSLLSAMEQGAFVQELEQNNNFRQKFEYALADMNAHPLHLLQYLKAILCERPSGQTEEAVFLEKLFWPEEIKNIFRKINTPSFLPTDGMSLESYLAGLY